MTKTGFYITEDIPPEFSVYDKKIQTLEIGTPGKVGILKIELERDEQKNKTIITGQLSQVPLYAQRAIHYDEANPEMAYLFIMSPSGGILQGDRYTMDFTLKKNAIANIATQGATRIYKMDANYAIQAINISVDENCYLEFIPDQIIPYKSSRYYQRVTMKTHSSATLVYSEVVTPGRVAMGEFFSYDILYLKTIGRTIDGKLQFVDSQLLEPATNNFAKLGILGEHTIFGSIYIVTPKKFQIELQEKITSTLKNNSSIQGGCSFLPENSGIIVRILGNSYDDIRTSIYSILKIVRKTILNSSFSEIRKS
jgi:urease accessory protein